MLRSSTVNTKHDLLSQGKSVSEVALELHRPRTTVRKYRDHPHAVLQRQRPPRPAKLDAYKDQMRQWVQADHCLNCEVLFARLKRMGYTSGLSFLKDFVRPLRPVSGHVLFDDGEVAKQVRVLLPDGVEVALELVGTPTLPDTLRATQFHGVVCFTGILSNQWTVRDFYPVAYLPRSVRLSASDGDAGDLPAQVLQGFLDAVAIGKARVPIDNIYRFDQIVETHAAMEAGMAHGKLVVLP